MSIRSEQYRALRLSRDLLRDMLDPKKTPRLSSHLRQRASSCLRHYPYMDDDGSPVFSRDSYPVIPDNCGDAGPHSV